ncbi:Protein MID1-COMPLEMENTING ACTIVITY 1 [Morella rubra]|uniref:Protein MID1-COMPLEMENTING ACTIVITY 1 n=1 Tax=Morella rubra TaxID=262757 RepID=A0A6A1UHE0_9ROSI|nr:Protein MID1-COMPLEMENTING ACTIVITY 1 [Morella rubra]
MASWESIGELANVAQLTGIDAVRLIGMIVKAANTARMHKKNCRQFALHLKLIGNLLEQLKISELKKYPETREPLEQLEDALRRSYVLVNSCQDRSYLYLLAMGWNIVYQFRKAQNEIDRYLRLVPLITLVDNARVRIVGYARSMLTLCISSEHWRAGKRLRSITIDWDDRESCKCTSIRAAFEADRELTGAAQDLRAEEVPRDTGASGAARGCAEKVLRFGQQLSGPELSVFAGNGRNIVYQFRKAQNEIDRYLRLVPLITLVDNARERLEDIEKDQREYTLDEEDRKVQDVILQPDPLDNVPTVLKKTLSCSYPNLPFNVALRKENEKLQLELQRSQAHLDVDQCQVIQHLLEVTEAAATTARPEKSLSEKGHKNVEQNYSETNSDNEHSSDEGYHKRSDTRKNSRNTSSVSSGHDLLSTRREEWHTDLLGCCSEPCLCIKTFLFPCGTFSMIATVATNRHMSPAEACNDLMAYSLILSCCCYTCNVRRKLRKTLNITGGFIDDFLSHLMCCCCALVQEWREVEIRGVYGKHLSALCFA